MRSPFFFAGLLTTLLLAPACDDEAEPAPEDTTATDTAVDTTVDTEADTATPDTTVEDTADTQPPEDTATCDTHTTRFAQTLRAPEEEAGAFFGAAALELPDGRLLIGAPGATVGGIDGAGRVWVFERDADGAFAHTTSFTAPFPTENARFGVELAFRDPLLAVGAVREADRGAVYLYDTSSDATLANPTALSAPSGAGDIAFFGIELAFLSDVSLAIGADSEDAGGVSDSGAVHVFSNTNGNWSVTRTLLAPDAADDDSFGAALAFTPERLFVGAPFDDQDDIDQGAVFAFSTDTLEYSDTLTPGISWNVLFGTDLAATDTHLVVGTQLGRAFLFDVATLGEPTQTLRADDWCDAQGVTDCDNSDLMGSDVATTRGLVFVSSPWAEVDGAFQAGAVYTFTLDGTPGARIITEATPTLDDNFGADIHATPDLVLITAQGDDSRGRVELYDLVLACE